MDGPARPTQDDDEKEDECGAVRNSTGQSPVAVGSSVANNTSVKPLDYESDDETTSSSSSSSAAAAAAVKYEEKGNN